jgi:glyoxylase-like metal-dependent hydrolase (beta-lactamase superfamily II)
MIIEKRPVGPLMANCFVIGCPETRVGAVIDPGGDVDRILEALSRHRLTNAAIINTHGHFDHVSGNRELKEATGADIMIHPADAPMLSQLARSAGGFGLAAEDSPPPDRLLEPGDRIPVGQLELTVLPTPGHTPGGISLFTPGHVFVGDALFAGSIGRTDFPGGDFDTLIRSIHEQLFTLDDDVVVYTGHGPETTIRREKRHNPFAALR